MKNKDDMIPISEYNRFIGKAEKELHDRLDELIRIQKLIHVLKSKVKKLEEENSLESKTCQSIINQINLLEQLRRRSSIFLVQVNRSLNYIEPKSNTTQKEGINEMKNNADDKIHVLKFLDNLVLTIKSRCQIIVIINNLILLLFKTYCY